MIARIRYTVLTKIVFLFGMVFYFSENAKAQNLVPNGDFEEYSSLPNNISLFHLCNEWLNPNEASPDYYHVNATGPTQLPNTSNAYVEPYSGNAVAGIILTSPNNYREYIMAPLTSPLRIGKEYHFSCVITNGQTNQNSFSSEFYGMSSDHFGIRFTTYDYYTNSIQVIPGINPQLEIYENIWDTNWREISFDFVADSTYNFLIIGNFYSDWESTMTNHLPSNTNVHTAFYFIDKVELIKKIYPVYIEMPNIFTPNEDGINDVYKPINITGVEQLNLSIYNRWGELVFQTNDPNTTWDGKFNDLNCSDGVYYWIINYTDLNEKSNLTNGFLTLSR